MAIAIEAEIFGSYMNLHKYTSILKYNFECINIVIIQAVIFLSEPENSYTQVGSSLLSLRTQKLSWAEARKVCQEEGGDLVVDKHYDEHDDEHNDEHHEEIHHFLKNAGED